MHHHMNKLERQIRSRVQREADKDKHRSHFETLRCRWVQERGRGLKVVSVATGSCAQPDRLLVNKTITHTQLSPGLFESVYAFVPVYVG